MWGQTITRNVQRMMGLCDCDNVRLVLFRFCLCFASLVGLNVTISLHTHPLSLCIFLSLSPFFLYTCRVKAPTTVSTFMMYLGQNQCTNARIQLLWSAWASEGTLSKVAAVFARQFPAFSWHTGRFSTVYIFFKCSCTWTFAVWLVVTEKCRWNESRGGGGAEVYSIFFFQFPLAFPPHYRTLHHL